MNYSFDNYWKSIFKKRTIGDIEHQSVQSKEIIEWHKKFIKKIGPSLFKNRKIRVLDIGCGTGYLTNLFCKFSDEVFGVDYLEEFIIEAKLKYNKPKFVNCNIYNLDKIEGDFDLVVCFGIMQHLSDLETALKNIKLKLSTKKQSKALITTMNSNSIFYKNNLRFKFVNPTEIEKLNYNLFSKQEYLRVAKLFDLKITKYDYMFVLPVKLSPLSFFIKHLLPSTFSHHIFIEMQHL